MKRTISSLLYKTRVPFILILFAGIWKINTGDPHPVIVLTLGKIGQTHPETIRIAYIFSMILYTTGLWLRIAGSSILGSDVVWKKAPSARFLEKSGIYRSIRHPIHLGSILILLSFLPLNSPPSAGIILFLAIPFILFLAHHEDQFLEKQFQDFQAYRHSVPGFIPQKGTLRYLFAPFDDGPSRNIFSGIRSEFLNISFLGGFAGFIWGENTRSFWWGMGTGITLTLLLLLFRRSLSPGEHG